MLVFFLLFFFCHLFPAFNLGAFLFCFFVPSSMPCFHVTTLSPLHPMLQRLRLGFSVAGWALGRFRSIRFGSGRYPEQFTDTTTGVCEGFLCPVSRIFYFFFSLCTIRYLALRDARNVPCRELASGNGHGHSGILLYSFQHISYCLVLGINCSEAIILSRADIWSDGACLVGLETSLLSFASFLLLFLMMNMCPLGSDDPPIHFL